MGLLSMASVSGVTVGRNPAVPFAPRVAHCPRIEINISSPNMHLGCAIFQQPDTLKATYLLKLNADQRRKPLFVKLATIPCRNTYDRQTEQKDSGA